MPKKGRPKVDKDKLKDGIFTFRVSADERGQIESAAGRAGLLASRWAREVVLAKARKT